MKRKIFRRLYPLALLSIILSLFLGCSGRPKHKEENIIEFWTTDIEQDRIETQQRLAQKFGEKNPGIEIKIVAVEESRVPEKLTAARAAGKMPDVVRLGLEYVSGYQKQKLLDTKTASKIIEELGEHTFFEAPLELLRLPDQKGYAAVPVDGWVQGIWYRKDLFEEKNLPEPRQWKDILEAAKAFYEPGKLMYGIVVGTDPQQVYTQQVFEHIALSNGARIFNSDGSITGNFEKLEEAVKFYYELASYGPPGNNYWREARQYYLTGRVAMIFYSPYIIDDIAGLDKEQEVTVPGLAKKTGFVPIIEGPQGDRASYGQVVAFAVMKNAEKDAAKKWIKFLLSDGYLDLCFMSPGGKVPVRKTIIDEWKKHEYFSYYEPEMAEKISNGMAGIKRWGWLDGKVFPLITDIYAKRIFPAAIDKVIADEMSPEKAVRWAIERIKEF